MKRHDWQNKALAAYQQDDRRDFVANVCPAAGKTRWACDVSLWLLETNRIDRVLVVCPNTALRPQWADAAYKLGLNLDPDITNDQPLENRRDYIGGVVTYAQVARQPDVHRIACSRYRTLVVFDEIHHAGDQQTWGQALLVAFEHADRRLMLTGTLFRPKPDQCIPFVEYPEPDRYAEDHYRYLYGEAVAEGVCRGIDFLSYDTDVHWIQAGAEVSTTLGSDLQDEHVSAALDSALLEDGDYMRRLLTLANEHLVSVRQEFPDAGGLVVAYRKDKARAYAKRLKEIAGEEPVLVLSEDDDDAHAKIEAFRNSTKPWIVAVQMVSEGVDIPRLFVGVWATKVRTPLFFRQVVGRFVRRRSPEEPAATLFMPCIPELVRHAQEVELELRKMLEETAADYEEELKRQHQERLELNEKIPLLPGDAEFDRLIRNGNEYTSEYELADEICRASSIPAHYAAALASELTRRGLSGLVPPPSAVTVAEPTTPVHRRKVMLRNELDRLVKIYCRLTTYEWKLANRLVAEKIGAYRSEASVEQLERGIEAVKKWIADQ